MDSYNINEELICIKDYTFCNTKKYVTIYKGEIYKVVGKEEFESGRVFYLLHNSDRDLYLYLWNEQERLFVDNYFNRQN